MESKFDEATGLYRAGDLAVSTALTQDLLGTAYLRFKAEQTIETIYYEGVPDLLSFLQTCTEPSHICLGAFVDRTNSRIRRGPRCMQLAGMSWVFHRQQMSNGMWKAETGFSFFRKCTTSAEKVALGKLMVEALFSHFNIDILFGSTPTDNQAALQYARNVGFTVAGAIPNAACWEGELTSVQVSSLTKKDWAKSLSKGVSIETPVSTQDVSCETDQIAALEAAVSQPLYPKIWEVEEVAA